MFEVQIESTDFTMQSTTTHSAQHTQNTSTTSLQLLLCAHSTTCNNWIITIQSNQNEEVATDLQWQCRQPACEFLSEALREIIALLTLIEMRELKPKDGGRKGCPQ